MAATSQPPPVNGLEARRAARLFWITAAIATVFCIGVISALVIRHVQSKVDDPLESRELIALKARLLETPKDEHLKEQIRALDLRLRQVYFRQIAFQAAGAWLLAAGGVLLVWSARQAARFQAQVYCPRLVTDAAERQDRLAVRARQAVIGVVPWRFWVSSRWPCRAGQPFPSARTRSGSSWPGSRARRTRRRPVPCRRLCLR